MTEPTLRILSLGAGVQSTTLALMACDGDLPGLDGAIFADTLGEPAAVYEQVEKLQAEFTRASIPLYRVNTGDLRSDSINPAHRYASIPYFVRNPDGSEGMGRRQCTSEYKLRPILRKCRELLGAKPPDFRSVPRGKTVEQWVGFSTDEVGRVNNKRDVKYAYKRYPLLELGMSRKDCRRYLDKRGWGHTAKSACVFCLAGETEVITDNGIRPIRDLAAEGHATVLVPRPRSAWASWRDVEVRSFGVQRLWRVDLVRRREKRTIYTTAEHRWRLWTVVGWSDFVTTAELRAMELQSGELRAVDRIPIARARSPLACGPNLAAISPIGVMAGFTFGDGSRVNRRHGAAYAQFFIGKDEPLLPYFAGLPIKEYADAKLTAGRYYRVWGLPRSWKDTPPLNEARGYLLGWLAGYFAADGHVDKIYAKASFSSARRENLQYVRDVCAILGIQTTAVRAKDHPAIGGRIARIYEVGIYYRDLPVEFWILPHHRERVVRRMSEVAERREGWTVASVGPTDRVEEVFCAIVPGEEMFVLDGDIVTGNCPLHGNRQWRQMREERPQEWADAVDFDRAIRNGGARGLPLNGKAYLHRSRVPLDEAPIGRYTLPELKDLQGDLFDLLEDGDPDGCSPYGCISGEPV